MTGRCSLFLLLLLLAPCAQAQEADGLEAWAQGGRRGPPPSAPPEPLALEVLPADGLDQRLQALGEAEDWGGVISVLRERARQPLLRDKLMRGPGGILLGAQEDARRRLLALSPTLRAGHDADLEEAQARELLGKALRGERDLLAVAEQFPATQAAAQATLRLCQSLAEEGALDEARYLLRDLDGPRARQLRFLLRALPAPFPGPGRVGRPAALSAPPRLLWARRAPLPGRRPLALDAARVYLTDTAGVLAVDRRDGRLRWRLPLGGVEERRDERLALGHGLLLHLMAGCLRALDARSGRLVWEHPLASLEAAAPPASLDALHAVSATPGGFLLLATLGEERWALGLSPAGEVTWRTKLWPAGASLAGWSLVPRRVPRDPAQSETPESPGYHVQAEAQPRPGVLGDGRLGVLGGHAFLTIDGLVASLGAERGQLRWVQERLLGQARPSGSTWVALSVTPRLLSVTTASGLRVLLDPLDGRLMPPPHPPRSETDDDGVGARLYPLLGAPPLDAWWRPGAPDRLELVLAGRPLTALERRLVSGPAAAWGGLLGLPGPGALRLLEPRQGATVATLQVPAQLGAGALTSGAGGLLWAGQGGVALFGAEASAPAAAPLPRDAPLPVLLAALDDPDWQRRWEARDRLEARVLEQPLELPAGTSPGPEAGDALRELTHLAARRARWRRLAPQADVALLASLVERPTPRALRRGLAQLAAVPTLAEDLRAELKDLAAEPACAWEVAETLLLREPLLQGQLVFEIRQSNDGPYARAAAELLVSLARRGGSLEPLQRALQHPDLPTRGLVVLALSGDEALRARLGPPDFWQAAMQDAVPQVVERWGQQLFASEPREDVLRRNLIRALADE